MVVTLPTFRVVPILPLLKVLRQLAGAADSNGPKRGTLARRHWRGTPPGQEKSAAIVSRDYGVLNATCNDHVAMRSAMLPPA